MNYLNPLRGYSLTVLRRLLDKTQRIMSNDSDFNVTVHVCAAEALSSWAEMNQRNPSFGFVTQIRAVERGGDIQEAVLFLNPEMDEEERTQILEAITAIPQAERHQVIELASLLIARAPKIAVKHIVRIFDIIVTVPQAERHEVVERVASLMNPESDTWHNKCIIKELAAIPRAERREVCELVIPFIDPATNGWGRANTLRKIAAIPRAERGHVWEMAAPLMPPAMQGWCKQRIFLAIAAIPREERTRIVEGALLLDEGIPVLERIEIAGNRWRRAQVPVVQADLRELAAEGVNIHDDDRDLRTGEAVVLLRTHQGPMNEEMILEAKNAFAAYLNASLRKEKEKALFAFEGPKGENESFGSLIDGREFGLRVVTLKGDELIGRLWIYASSLSEKDSTNAKEAMISALAQSYASGERVCNQGKSQRLVVGVLQGNLGGVNIEGSLLDNGPLPVVLAEREFFEIEANRQIRNLGALREAANQFLAHRPRVNKEEFLVKLEAYARLTFDEEQKGEN